MKRLCLGKRIMDKKILEKDLYRPVANFLLEQGFDVRSEVKNCDIMAVRGEEIVLIELKRNFQMKLLYQAIDRQTMSDQVYVCIPRPTKAQNDSQWRNMLRLLKRLDLGLITVAMDSPVKMVNVHLEPDQGMGRKNKKKKSALLREFEGRTEEMNEGGMSRKKVVTAYMEQAIEMLCVVERLGKTSAKELKSFGYDTKQTSILSKNFYHWYEKVSKGIYTVGKEGKDFLLDKRYGKLISYYRKKAEQIENTPNK